MPRPRSEFRSRPFRGPRRLNRAGVLTACALVAGCAVQSPRDATAPVAGAEASAEAPAPANPSAGPGRAADAILLEQLRRRAQQHAASPQLRLDRRPLESEDVWGRIRRGFGLPRVDNPRVRAELAWYTGRPDYVRRMTDRARPYLAYIVHQAERRGLPSELALLPFVESAFQPYARSPAGAVGIWQFIRSTGRHYGLDQSAWYDGRRDIVESTRAAFDYLQKLHRDMEGDWLLAVAAYNAGEGAVLNAVRRNRARGQRSDFWSLDLPAETRAYVPRLLAVAALVAQPRNNGLELDPIDDEPYFRMVRTRGQTDLARAAEMARISLDELMLLNPGYMRHATDPRGPHRLLLPADASPAFERALLVRPDDARPRLARYEVVRGDTLSGIAGRFGLSIGRLREINQLDDNLIRVGQEIRVPGRRAKAFEQVSPEVRDGMRRARASATRTVHRVRAGDSLWTIARRHRTSVARLVRLNGLSRQAVLRPGQRIVIAPRGDSRPRSKSAPATQSVHRVRSGESLWNIARRYGVSVEQLARWNEMSPDAVLRPGRRLTVRRPSSI